MTDGPPSAYGADRIEPGEAGEVVLECPVSKSWTARSRGTRVRAEHPGTAVAWEDRLYEVRSSEPMPGGGMRYRLAPWEDSHAVRRFERYDAESETQRAAGRAELADALRHRRLSILLGPLAGLLPGPVQKEMESSFGAPAVGMTIASALPMLVAGFLGMFGHILGMAGGRLDWPIWLAPPLPIALYLFLESALRLGSALAGGEPMGSLPVVVAWAAWREARGEGPKGPAGADLSEADRERKLRDRFTLLEPLLSLLPADRQSALQARFGFDAVRWGRVTGIVLFATGALNAIAALGALAGGRVDGFDVLGLLLGALLVGEQVARFVRLSHGEPAGSVFGAFVRPMAAPLFAD